MKIYILSCFIFQLSTAIELTWIWAEDFDGDTESLSVDYPENASFIQLEHLYGDLVIHLVHRGTNWPKDSSFCKVMLPAVISQFLEKEELRLGNDIRRIKVCNVADPRIAGCKCYVRLMVDLGFRWINSRQIESDSEISSFCSSMHIHEHDIIAELHGSDPLKLVPSEFALQALRQAKTYYMESIF
jgi:hypothetical protein